MPNKPSLVSPTGDTLKSKVAKVAAVHPFGSKILVEVLNIDEMLGTNLYVDQKTSVDGAPQAFIVEVGPSLPEGAGIRVGQRIYWTGQGTAVEDPRTANGRKRAILDLHNILAIIEEDSNA